MGGRDLKYLQQRFRIAAHSGFQNRNYAVAFLAGDSGYEIPAILIVIGN